MIHRDIASIRNTISSWRADSKQVRIGLVPTMGALHEGHLSLVDEARRRCDRVVVSIFVNPTQFDSKTDLAAYPRTEAEDIALLAGADAVFIPSVEVMYPSGFSSQVQVRGLADRLEGVHRPGHFDGMATVVTKLFGISGADLAFFGEKDWQQLQIVRRLVADLDLPVGIVPCPTLREADGLALSSRNRRLSPEARAIAPRLHAIMQDCARALRAGDRADECLETARRALGTAGFTGIDYLVCADAETLAPSEPAKQEGRALRLLAAASLGSVRLIDNIVI
ncbi:pantoate--beta-alanine ligase [Swaminathania salitolerans]|uniref:Pantothenate synthetase n=1 Tax=Swaminathania salitolerans TaxID=182838 RepID=A0A511BQA4_9PROT|nr:pantoate--beta-alanine ligase [Swaminathania salitolerans]GBQ11547.1 pantoate--beta-alanine ligase [Swaminathania salitolerans LMG 21291]GEL02526.1 pantothenate synthetase [Swaminathania salitolerans]